MGIVPHGNWGRYHQRLDVVARILDAMGMRREDDPDRYVLESLLLDLSDYGLYLEARKYAVDSVGLAKLKDQELRHERRMT